MERAFPLDSTAVLRYGVDRWQEDCQWPVPEHEFIAICASIERCVAQHIAADPVPISDALLVKRSLPIEYWHFLHAAIVLARLRAANMVPSADAGTPWYRILMDDVYDAYPNGELGKPLVHAQPERAWAFDRATYARAARMLVVNVAHGKSPFPWGSRPTVASLGAPPMYVRAHTDTLPHRLSITTWRDWCSVAAPIDHHASDAIRSCAETIADELRDIAATCHLALTAVQHRYLAQYTERQLRDAAAALAGIRNRLRGAMDTFVYSMPGHQAQRALALAVRANGMRVVSFAHSGSLALFDSYTMSVNEFALSDEFVTLTAGSVPYFERIRAAHPPLRGNQVRIIPGACDEYVATWEREQRSPPPARVERVLVIGFPHGPWRKPQGAGLFWQTMLDFELRLVRALQEEGYAVTYKAHPDRLREVEAIFGSRTRVLGGDLRDAFDAADAFVASSVRTTAFHLALCTQKLAIGFLVEPDQYPMFPDVRERLARRCALLSLCYDERGRLQFNRDALRAALAQHPQVPDRLFLDTHLTPRPCVPASSS